MIKHLTIKFSLFFLLLICNSHAMTWPLLQETWEKIQTIPAAQQVYAAVQQEGPMTLQIVAQKGEAEAYWEAEKRQIIVNSAEVNTEADLIRVLLFELHNALSNRLHWDIQNRAFAGQLDIEMFVQEVERLEYANVQACSKIIDEGIASGLFPPESHFGVLNDFESHYLYQQLMGHSQWIANYYPGPKAIYQGSLSILGPLSEEDKVDLTRYLVLKSNLKHPQQKQASELALFNEFVALNACAKGELSGPLCKRSQERLRLLEKANLVPASR